jgi:hypothetical protein
LEKVKGEKQDIRKRITDICYCLKRLKGSADCTAAEFRRDHGRERGANRQEKKGEEREIEGMGSLHALPEMACVS